MKSEGFESYKQTKAVVDGISAENQTTSLPNRPGSVHKLAHAEKIESRKRFGEKIVDEITTYRFRGNIGAEIESIADKTRESTQYAIVSFNKDFQKDYVRYKAQLAGVLSDVRNFIDHPNRNDVDPLVDKITRQREFASSSETIRKQLTDYCGQTGLLSDIIDQHTVEELFKKITGKKPRGLIDHSRRGNALVLYAYDDNDYALLLGENKKAALLSAGFYRNGSEIRMRDGKKVSIPIIVIRSAFPEKFFDSDANWEDYQEYLREAYEEATGKNPMLEDEHDFTKHYLNWSGHPPAEYSYDAYIADRLRRDIDWASLDHEEEFEILNYQKDIHNVTAHEKQHHSYAHLIIEHSDETFKVNTKEDIANYFENILQNCLKRLGDEIIATAQDKIIEWDFDREQIGKEFGGASLEELENVKDKDFDTEENIDELRKFKRSQVIRLVNSLYFYPRQYRSAIFRELKEKVSSEKLQEWNIEGLWWERVIDPFTKRKKQLEMIGTYFTKQAFEQYSSENAQNLLKLWEIEPVESWPRLFYWFRHNPQLVREVIRGNRGPY